MQYGVSELLNTADKLKFRADKITFLRNQGNNKAFVIVMQYAFHPEIKWMLPKGKFPYKQNVLPEIDTMLLSQARKLYLFVEVPGQPNTLDQKKRETLFVQMLESLNEDDANLLMYIKDNKKLPQETITYELVSEAFPGILPPKSEVVVTPEETFPEKAAEPVVARRKPGPKPKTAEEKLAAKNTKPVKTVAKRKATKE